ncbi:MAG: polymer-forming cytoskeletal protein [Gemmatimonadetes bacterium]|nr:polymer-forming cytoskeletal protein [Gemmatimonadota bacterium]
MTISGDCIVEGLIRIEGTIVGDVRAAGLELARSGSVKGDLTATGGDGGETFVIAGEVDGRVHAPKVEVGPNGTVLGGVDADEAKVRGRVEKGIVARKRLTLEETAVVEGDVRATVLALKEGGQVNGTIVMGERAASTEAKPRGASTTTDPVVAKGGEGAAA